MIHLGPDLKFDADSKDSINKAYVSLLQTDQ